MTAQTGAAPPAAALPADDLTHSVIDAVRHGATTRADVATAAGRFSKEAINQRIRQLIRAGLLREGTDLPSRGGRPPKQLRLNSRLGHVLAADVGLTHARISTIDLVGQVLRTAQTRVDVAGSTPEVVFEQVVQVIDELEATPDAGPLCGIGMGLPATVDFATGRTLSPLNRVWDDYPARDRLSDQYQVPTWVDNDVNVIALAELGHGAARNHRDALVIKIGASVGAGLLSNGRLHRGAQGNAGTMVLDETGGRQLLHKAEQLAAGSQAPGLRRRSGAGPLTLDDLIELAEAGDPDAVRLITDAADQIGDATALAINWFNPSIVIIAGGLGTRSSTLLARFRKAVYETATTLATRDLQIVPSPLGADASTTGAAHLALDGIFGLDRLAGTLSRLGAR